MASLFFSYSHKDEQLRDQLEVHLAMLKNQGVISTWHDRRILAGDDFGKAIDTALNAADVILFLVSPDFLASKYCYDIEVKLALERNSKGEARVIPVILRPCDWLNSVFAHLTAAPRDGKPVISWPVQDEAFLDVVQAIRRAASKPAGTTVVQPAPPPPAVSAPSTPTAPRSSNLRLRRTFTQADQDRHMDEAYDFIALFFENSLNELKARQPDIDARFRPIDARTFTATVYRSGKRIAACTIRNGGVDGIGGGLTYLGNDSGESGSFNESLSVMVTEQALGLKPLGMSMRGGDRDALLSFEGAAEFLWSLLIGPLQQQ